MYTLLRLFLVKLFDGMVEDLCDYCIRAINYTLHYLRLSHLSGE